MMKALHLVLTVSALSALALAGCSNTFDGAGRDIEKAGQNIQKNF
jgi:predicted small secreted protein